MFKISTINSINITKIINYDKNNKLKRTITLSSNGHIVSVTPKVKLKGVVCSASRVHSVLEELESRKENIVVLLYIV